MIRVIHDQYEVYHFFCSWTGYYSLHSYHFLQSNHQSPLQYQHHLIILCQFFLSYWLKSIIIIDIIIIDYFIIIWFFYQIAKFHFDMIRERKSKYTAHLSSSFNYENLTCYHSSIRKWMKGLVFNVWIMNTR